MLSASAKPQAALYTKYRLQPIRLVHLVLRRQRVNEDALTVAVAHVDLQRHAGKASGSGVVALRGIMLGEPLARRQVVRIHADDFLGNLEQLLLVFGLGINGSQLLDEGRIIRIDLA